MGEHQLTIRDYLRHSNLNVTNQYLQATSKTKLLAQGKLSMRLRPRDRCPRASQPWFSKSCRPSIALLSRELRMSVLWEMERLMDPNGPRFSKRVFVCD